ncbi:two-component system response regulator [Pirellulaceae bacterium SH449]
MLSPNAIDKVEIPSPHVLVIDDCRDIQALIGKILSPTGARLSYASGGVDGLRMAADLVPTLILLDYFMPDCDGMEVLKQLQADRQLKHIPVIMITGDKDPSLIASAFSQGICDYISKPFLPIELRARVCSALKTQSLMEDLKQRAGFDALTGLPNKATLFERIQISIDASQHGLDLFAVMFIDLDRFKLINDSLGHDCGDLVLREAAKRLKASVRGGDLIVRRESNATVARFGGDEFIILIESIPNVKSAESIASRILSAMSNPLTVGGRMLYLTASIGVVTSSGQYTTIDELIRDADIAMYEAKEAGRGCFRSFDPSMRIRAIQRWQIDADLRQAIELNQFALQYQPIVNLETGLVESVEALIRWNHPEKGRIPPIDFIPIAEETGLIVAIGEWVMRTACQQFADWFAIDSDSTPNHISINLSRQQLVQSEFLDLFQSALAQSGISPSSIHFEITESEMMEDLATSVEAIKKLRSLGAKIDLDDFGTGHSSLACLHELPLDVLKLDRSLITNIDEDVYRSKLVDLVIKLLSETHIQVVAEGIETFAQLSKLQELDCHYGQGYYFAKPLDADQVQPFVRKMRLEQPKFRNGELRHGDIYFVTPLSISQSMSMVQTSLT